MRSICCLAAVLALCAAGCTIPTLELRQLAGDGNFCTVTTDCCVVVDECQGEAFVITDDELDVAEELLAQRQQTECVRCPTPPVAVECVEGRCRGKSFDPADVSYGDNQPLNSCGARELSTTEQDLRFVALEEGVATCNTLPIDS